MSDDPTRRNEDEQRRLDEAELRDDAEWLDNIGPEYDEDNEIAEENLEAYGIDRMDDSHFESEPTASSDNPDWLSKRGRERSNADFPHNRNPDGMFADDDEADET